MHDIHRSVIDDRESRIQIYKRRIHDNRSMRGRIWSYLGHLGLTDLLVSMVMDASNSHADGRADKPSDSRSEVSLSYSYSYSYTNRYTY